MDTQPELPSSEQALCDAIDALNGAQSVDEVEAARLANNVANAYVDFVVHERLQNGDVGLHSPVNILQHYGCPGPRVIAARIPEVMIDRLVQIEREKRAGQTDATTPKIMTRQAQQNVRNLMEPNIIIDDL